jgi:SAM-dependent methyltransferase
MPRCQDEIFDEESIAVTNRYQTSEYFEMNPGWHTEESPWKARQVIRMISRHDLAPKTICEVGSGAGEVLKQLQHNLDSECVFWGYDISPYAFDLSKSRANERLHFKLGDIADEEDAHFDLILVLDVIEHVEDYFTLLRAIKSKSKYKIFHIPLDLSVQTVLRASPMIDDRKQYGHIHYFTKETALQTLRDTGYEVVDYFYSAVSLDLPSTQMKNLLLRVPRKLGFAIHRDLTVRILGGYRLLVLAQ